MSSSASGATLGGRPPRRPNSRGAGCSKPVHKTMTRPQSAPHSASKQAQGGRSCSREREAPRAGSSTSRKAAQVRQALQTPVTGAAGHTLWTTTPDVARRRHVRPPSAKATKHRRVVDDDLDCIIYEDNEEVPEEVARYWESLCNSLSEGTDDCGRSSGSHLGQPTRSSSSSSLRASRETQSASRLQQPPSDSSRASPVVHVAAAGLPRPSSASSARAEQTASASDLRLQLHTCCSSQTRGPLKQVPSNEAELGLLIDAAGWTAKAQSVSAEADDLHSNRSGQQPQNLDQAHSAANADDDSSSSLALPVVTDSPQLQDRRPSNGVGSAAARPPKPKPHKRWQ